MICRLLFLLWSTESWLHRSLVGLFFIDADNRNGIGVTMAMKF